LDCGIPAITLEGNRSDWVKLFDRIEKLEEFGKEPSAWATLLRPILSKFVSAFDGDHDLGFWGKICHHEDLGSGPAYLSGWITAFCVWSNNGKWQGPGLDPSVTMRIPSDSIKLELEGVKYGVLDTDKIPTGFCEVDVDLDDNGQHFDCMMVSGHVARKTTGENLDTVTPMPGWFMFIKEVCEDPEEVAVRKLMEEMDEKYGKLK